MFEQIFGNVSWHIIVVYLPLYFALMNIIFKDLSLRAQENRSAGQGYDDLVQSTREGEAMTCLVLQLLADMHLEKVFLYRRKIISLGQLLTTIGLLFTTLGIMSLAGHQDLETGTLTVGLKIALTSTALSAFLLLIASLYIIGTMGSVSRIKHRIKQKVCGYALSMQGDGGVSYE